MKQQQLQLTQLLQTLFALQGRDVLNRLNLGVVLNDQKVRLDHWLAPSVRVLKPLLLLLFQQGVATTASRLADKEETTSRVGGFTSNDDMRTYSPGNDSIFGVATSRKNSKFKVVRKANNTIDVSSTLYNPRILNAIDEMVFTLCKETLDTVTTELETALTSLRTLLKQGVESGAGLSLLSKEVQRIFNNPFRAYRIATTESSRAIHAGQIMAAKESGIVSKKEWLASVNACPACLDLDGEERDLDEPFVVEGSGPYAQIQHPPRHPGCQCTMTEVL